MTARAFVEHAGSLINAVHKTLNNVPDANGPPRKIGDNKAVQVTDDDPLLSPPPFIKPRVQNRDAFHSV